MVKWIKNMGRWVLFGTLCPVVCSDKTYLTIGWLYLPEYWLVVLADVFIALYTQKQPGDRVDTAKHDAITKQ